MVEFESNFGASAIYSGIPMANYLAHPAVSNSNLSNILRSPAFAEYDKAHPRGDTDATALGTAIHMAILEPERFEEHYQLDPTDENGGYHHGWRNTKAYKAAKGDILAHGFQILKQSDLDSCRHICENVWNSAIGHDVLSIADDNEVSVLVDDPEYDLMRKIRPDVVVTAANMLVDIKKTRDIRPSAFARDCASFGYHRTAAWYLDTANLAWDDAQFHHYLFLVVADTPPHEIRGYTLDAESVEFGRAQYRDLLCQWAQCAAEGVWPGSSGRVEELSLPRWVFNQEV